MNEANIKKCRQKLNFKNLATDTSLFRKLFLISLSFEMIAFLDIPALVFKCFVLSWGLFILINNFFIGRKAFEVKYKYILWAFLSLMVVTSFVHMSIWFIPNIVLVLYTAACFFMFYGMYTESPPEAIEEEMVFILRFFIFFGLICAILSLLTLFLKNEINIYSYNLGIFKNRLIGIYTNSNILAFSMVESVVACDLMSTPYMKNKFKNKKLNNWFLLGCIVLSCVCVFLSDSNASFLFLIIYATMRVFCNLFFQNQTLRNLKFLKSSLIVMSFCMILMSVSFSLRNTCQRFIVDTVNDISVKQEAAYVETSGNGGGNENSNSGSGSVSVPEPDEKSKNSVLITPEKQKGKETELSDFHIGRKHYEVSSGRLTLWKQGLEMFKHNPWIGIGRANLNMFAKKYLKNGLIHPDLHNGYLTILVCYGIIGFLIFGGFSILVAFDICKNMFLCVGKNYFDVIVRIFSMLVAYCGYCLFEKAILFDMTFMVGFFWTMLGYEIFYINKFSKGVKNIENK